MSGKQGFSNFNAVDLVFVNVRDAALAVSVFFVPLLIKWENVKALDEVYDVYFRLKCALNETCNIIV